MIALKGQLVAEALQAQDPLAAERVWGVDPVAMHDRLWASKRVQVVRLGQSHDEHHAGLPDAGVSSRGPQMYLLLGRHDLAIFTLRPLIKRYNWLKPRAMRLRLVETESAPSQESVEATDEDRFVAVRRHYRPRTRCVRSAWLTADPRLARAWAKAAGPREGHREIRKSTGFGRLSSAACPAVLFDGGSPAGRDRCALHLLTKWSNPAEVLDGIYQFQHGVWVHETAVIEPGVRFVGPAWVGAGVAVHADRPVIGPLVLADAPGASPDPGEIYWDALHYPVHPLIARPRRQRLRHVSKRLFDIGFSLAVLTAIAPIVPLIALAILIEDGWPPFFGHKRQTLSGREFRCWKFRTMCRNAESLKAQLAAQNRCDGPQFFIENDPRLLRVGKILRRYQLDELPQFWNVLMGHMSVVGPRPSPDKENQFCPTWREGRLSVRPGVTGLWQVRRTRAPQADFQEWIRYDLEYVQHQSWRLDVWIIYQTVKRIVTG